MEEKGEICCLVSKQQLTLGAASAAGWVPEFPCSCLHLYILFLRNLTRITSQNMPGFILPADTQSQCTVIKNGYKSKSYSLFYHPFCAYMVLVTEPCALQQAHRLIQYIFFIRPQHSVRFSVAWLDPFEVVQIAAMLLQSEDSNMHTNKTFKIQGQPISGAVKMFALLEVHIKRTLLCRNRKNSN